MSMLKSKIIMETASLSKHHCYNYQGDRIVWLNLYANVLFPQANQLIIGHALLPPMNECNTVKQKEFISSRKM